MKTKLLILTATIAFIATGCATHNYNQSAGVVIENDSAEDAATNSTTITYEFDPVTGNTTKVTVKVLNASEISMLDQSGFRGRSLLSKTDVTAKGTREGMLDNNTTVAGESKTEAEKAADILKAAADLKSPVNLSRDD